MFDATKTLLPWQTRVLNEQAELKEKLTKLNDFLRTDLTNIHPDERMRLSRQEKVMHVYLEILNERIEAWG